MQYLTGGSSAPGGETYSEETKGGSKTVTILVYHLLISTIFFLQGAFPIEFPNICELFTFVNTQPNLNIKTQLFGIGFGSVQNYFATGSIII